MKNFDETFQICNSVCFCNFQSKTDVLNLAKKLLQIVLFAYLSLIQFSSDIFE